MTGLFASCNDDGAVGLDLLPNPDGIGVFRLDTFSLRTYTVTEDSLEVQQPPIFALGEVSDPIFGLSKVGITYQVRLTNENINLGNNVQVDSLVLALSFDNYYGDTTDQLLLKVYELDETIYRDSVYYSNQVPAYKSTPLATFTYHPRPKGTVPVDEPRVNGIDTVFNYPGLLRIPLSADLSNRILAASGGPDLQNNTNFLNFFKGFYITAERVSSSATGSVMLFSTTSARNGLFMYYKTDTLRRRFDMLLTDQSARRNVFNFNYQGTEVGGRINDTSDLVQFGYVQAGGSVKLKVDMPYLRNLVKDFDVAINKAEVIFEVIPGSDNAPFTPPSRLFLLRADTLNGNSGFIVPDLVEPYYDGNLKNGQYKFVITRYVQDLLLSKRTDFGMVLIANNTISSTNRVVIGSSNNAMYKPKMIITFTKLK
ncbi:MAG: DUF4270 domain-containing protein [Sphingobacteriaceae bacterium]|nr:DUF4270 domain-containing protein [Sphingobacteriaceae bacterium]